MPKAKNRRSKGTPFEDMALPTELINELDYHGFTRAFEIQEAILPDALAGRDVLARAETGSGKTLAFTLAMTARFRGRRVHKRRPLGIVLVPTRELAVQVVDTIHPFARAVGIRAQLVAGGMNIEKQAEALRRGVAIIVATPGRVKDLAIRGDLGLDCIETTVIDEADHMADLGFLPQIGEILANIPMGTQKMLFSATLDDQVERIVDDFLVDPVTHETTPVAAAVKTMRHEAYAINPKRKREITAQIAARDGRTLIFTRTQLGAERVAQELVEVGVPAAALHGSKQQGMRTNVLAGFRNGAYDVLVATDVAARGIHIDDVSLVLHVDPPETAKDYVHRSGRTARAGAHGIVVTLVLPHQKDGVSRLLDAAEAPVQWHDVTSENDEVLRFVGGRAPSGEPAEDPAMIKHKGAPRRLDIRGGRGADQRRAEVRRENEARRSVYDQDGESTAGAAPRNRGGAGRRHQRRTTTSTWRGRGHDDDASERRTSRGGRPRGARGGAGGGRRRGQGGPKRSGGARGRGK